jgi:hypothetical protein
MECWSHAISDICTLCAEKRLKVSLRRRKPFLKQIAASYLANKQERNDGVDLAAAEVAVAATGEAAASQPVKGAKAGGRVPSPAKAPLQQPGGQVQEQVEIVNLISDSDDGRSSMPASQAVLQDDGVSAPREGMLRTMERAWADYLRSARHVTCDNPPACMDMHVHCNGCDQHLQHPNPA